MRKRAALAASCVAVLFIGSGLSSQPHRHVLAGYREQASALSVATVLVDRAADVAAQDAADEAVRVETERVAAVERQAEADRIAAERAKAEREAADAARVTTTVVRRPVAPTAPVSPVSTGSGACGGSLPPCWVMMRESGGNPRAVNSTGCGGRGCFGKWQMDPRTSAGIGYALTMDQYPESAQDDAARTLWRGGRRL
jgi:hypothetical protein